MTDARETKVMPIVRHVDGDGKATVVIASLGGEPDADGDITLPGFFGRQTVPVVPNHTWSVQPIGKARVFESATEAIAELRFYTKTTSGADYYEAIRADWEDGQPVQEYSYGFGLRDGGSSFGDFNGRRVRYLQPLKDGSPGVVLHEVSPVLRGAGIGTRTLAVKRHDDQAAGVLAAARRHVADYETEQRAASDYVRSIAAKLQDEGLMARWCTELSDWWDTDLHPVSEASVSGGLSHAAKSFVAHFARKLGISDPSVKWFREPGPVSIFGAANVATKTIMLNADQRDLAELWVTVAHELLHLTGADEKAARAYEKEARKELIAAC